MDLWILIRVDWQQLEVLLLIVSPENLAHSDSRTESLVQSVSDNIREVLASQL